MEQEDRVESPHRRLAEGDGATVRFPVNGDWPVAWRSGLRWLATTYLIFLSVMITFQCLKYSLAQIDARIAAMNIEFENLPNKRDLEALRSHNDKMEIEYHKMKTLRAVTLIGVLFAFTGLVTLILATWKITQQPSSPWETYARYLVWVPLLLVPLMRVGMRLDASKDLLLIISSVVLNAHFVSLFKIARSTGHFDIARQLEWTYQIIRVSFISIILVSVFATSLGLPSSLVSAIIVTMAVGWALATLVEVVLLWRLSARLG